MRILTVVSVPSTDYVCDRCGKKPMYNMIHICKMCGNDVCSNCDVLTDFSNLLEKNNYNGDYPDHICKVCWEVGEGIRKDIEQVRFEAENNENTLVANWKKLCMERK